jgi:hypothetical protein
MDIKKIIENKVEEIVKNGELEKQIENNVSKSVKSAIDSIFGSYSFKNEIEKKLKTEVDPILKNINLSAYKNIVHERAIQTIKSVVDGDLEEKAKETYKSIFMLQDKEIKISKLFEMIRQEFIDELDGGNYGEFFTLKWTEEDDGDSFHRIKIYFDKDPDEEKRNCEQYIYLSKYKDDNYEIYMLKTGHNIEIKDKLLLFKPHYLSDVERLLLNAYYNDLPIILDVDLDDIDNSLYDEN